MESLNGECCQNLVSSTCLLDVFIGGKTSTSKGHQPKIKNSQVGEEEVMIVEFSGYGRGGVFFKFPMSRVG